MFVQLPFLSSPSISQGRNFPLGHHYPNWIGRKKEISFALFDQSLTARVHVCGLGLPPLLFLASFASAVISIPAKVGSIVTPLSPDLNAFWRLVTRYGEGINVLKYILSLEFDPPIWESTYRHFQARLRRPTCLISPCLLSFLLIPKATGLEVNSGWWESGYSTPHFVPLVYTEPGAVPELPSER